MILSSATSKSSNFGPNGPSNQPFPDSTTSVDKSSNDSPIARPSTVLDQSDPAAKEELRNNLLNHASSARPARFCPNDLIEPYEEIEQIGRGAYGTVFKAQDRRNPDRFVAMKKIRFSLTEDGVPMAILREISLLKQLQRFDHPNIVRLLDITHSLQPQNRMVLSLIFEHVNQDLDAYLRNCPPPGLEPGRIQDIMFQLLHGVDFLHSHRIVHRDLKPQNLLVTRDGVVKITDFGLARIYDFYTLLTSVVVTLWYRSPEVLMCLSYDTSVDLWALGCIFAELHTRTALFEGQHERHQLSLIFGTIGTPSEDEWPEKANVMRSNFLAYPKQAWTVKVPTLEPQGQDLLDKLLQFHPDQRISASEAMKHPYFCDVQVSTAAPSSGGA